MNSQAIAQVASFLSVSPNQIKRCEEWASVLFVQVHGFRPRFVSKKVIMKNIGLTGFELPEGVSFDSMDAEFEYLDSLQPDWEGLVNQAIGDIAKYLPMGANPSGANLESMAYQVVDGHLTAQQAADRLSNKKIITLKK